MVDADKDEFVGQIRRNKYGLLKDIGHMLVIDRISEQEHKQYDIPESWDMYHILGLDSGQTFMYSADFLKEHTVIATDPTVYIKNYSWSQRDDDEDDED